MAPRSEAPLTHCQVDNFGNVYYADYKGTVSVIYRGGTRVADFITRVNPDAVKKSGGVQVGYIYFIAGTVNTSTCALVTSPISNNAFAFADTSDPNAPAAATANNIDFISLDSAGNIIFRWATMPATPTRPPPGRR